MAWFLNGHYIKSAWVSHRAAERADGTRGKGFTCAKCTKIYKLFSTRGQLINSVSSMCLHVSKNLSTLTLKALLIILPKHSLTESIQCNGKWKIVKMQPIKVKIIKIKSSWGPLKIWGPQGSIPHPLSGPDVTFKKYAPDYLPAAMNRISHSRILLWTTEPLMLLESVAEVPDQQVAKMGKSSTDWLTDRPIDRLTIDVRMA